MDKYSFPKTLSEPKRVAVLTLDEFIPASMVFILAFFSGSVMGAVTGAALLVILIRFAKQGRKIGWVVSLSYWWLPSLVTRCFFRFLPDSSLRHMVR